MTLDLNLNAIAQGLAIVLLGGIAKSVWSSAATLVKLNTKLDEHTAQDARNFEQLHEDIRELRGRQS